MKLLLPLVLVAACLLGPGASASAAPARTTSSFDGNDAEAWPRPWTAVSGAGATRSGKGHQTTPTGTYVAAEHRANLSATDGRVLATINFPATTNRAQRINIRWNPSTGDGYRLSFTPDYNGMQLMRVTAWQETVLAERFDLSWAAATDYKIRVEFVGPTIRVRRWTGAVEPPAWNLVGTDRTYSSGDVSLVTTSLGTAESVTGNWDNVMIQSIAPAVSRALTNPERGFFHYTETHERADGTGRVPLDVTTLQGQRAAGRTMVFRYYVLERFLGTDTIDQAYKDFIAADIKAARAAGVKLTIRFAYSTSGDLTPPYDADPPRARVVSHIRQLAPVLNSGADVIDAVQAGFIGMWGEWYYTDNFGDLGSVTPEQWADRKAVVDTLLTQLNPQIFVMIRYVGAMRRLIDAEPSNMGYATRLAHHNDAFLAAPEDWGTYEAFSTGYTAGQNRAWLAARYRSGRYPLTGETANPNSPRSDLPTALSELARYRWTSLSPLYHPDVLAAWGQSGREEVAARLGYRPSLVRATVDDRATAGAQTAVRFQIRNDGWAAPYRARPWQVVFVNGSTVVTRSLPGDFRNLAPQATTTVSGTVTAPTSAGTYRVYLLIPDASVSLRNNPLYAVSLDGATFDSTTGRNATGETLVVS